MQKIIETNEHQGKAQFISYTKSENPVISWTKESIKVEILMNDGSIKVLVQTHYKRIAEW